MAASIRKTILLTSCRSGADGIGVPVCEPRFVAVQTGGRFRWLWRGVGRRGQQWAVRVCASCFFFLLPFFTRYPNQYARHTSRLLNSHSRVHVSLQTRRAKKMRAHTQTQSTHTVRHIRGHTHTHTKAYTPTHTHRHTRTNRERDSRDANAVKISGRVLNGKWLTVDCCASMRKCNFRVKFRQASVFKERRQDATDTIERNGAMREHSFEQRELHTGIW